MLWNRREIGFIMPESDMSRFSYNQRGGTGTHGIRYADPQRFRQKRSKAPIVIILILLTAAGILWSAVFFWGKYGDHVRHWFSRRENPPATQTQAAASTQGNAGKAKAPDTTPISNPATERPNVNQTAETQKLTTRQKALNDQYEKAYVEFSRKEYTTARTTLRNLFDTATPKDPVYDKAAKLLGRTSLEIYHSGDDPETFEMYKVVSGDNLSSIAKRTQTTVEAIQRANSMATNNTRLKIGQELKIPRSTWSIFIRRDYNKLLLLSGDKLFKIYNIYPGSSISDTFGGKFKIVNKEPAPVWTVNGQKYSYGSQENICGARWMALNPVEGSGPSTAIHGTNRSGIPDTTSGTPGYFRMTNDDVTELYELVPKGTPVEIAIPML